MCSQALLGACAHRVPSPTRRGDAAAPPAVRFQGGRKPHVSAPVTRSDRRLAAPLPALPVSNQVAGVGGLLVPAPPDRRLLARWPTEGDLFTTRAGLWLWVDKCTDRPVWHATAETGKGMKAEPGAVRPRRPVRPPSRAPCSPGPAPPRRGSPGPCADAPSDTYAPTRYKPDTTTCAVSSKSRPRKRRWAWSGGLRSRAWRGSGVVRRVAGRFHPFLLSRW